MKKRSKTKTYPQDYTIDESGNVIYKEGNRVIVTHITDYNELEQRWLYEHAFDY